MSRLISTETLAVALLAIIFGLVGAYGLRYYLQEEPEEPAPEPAMIDLPIAATDLPANRVIQPGDVITKRVKREEVIKMAENMGGGNIMISSDALVGRRTLKPIRERDHFPASSLYLDGQGPNFLENLRPGFRAVSLTVPAQQGGWIQSGNLVDVLFRTVAQGATDTSPAIPELTTTLLERVEVLNVDTPERNGSPIVTLAVPVEEVASVQAVQGRGDFALVSRSSDENVALASTSSVGNVTLADVLGIEPPPAPAEPQQPFRTVVFRRGSAAVNSFYVDRAQYGSATGQNAAARVTAGLPPTDPNDPGCKSCKNKKKQGAAGVPTGAALQPTPAPAPAGN